MNSTNSLQNIEAIDQSLWLVKIPQFVSEQWAAANDDDLLGNLVITSSKKAKIKDLKQLNIKLDYKENASLPNEFILDAIPINNTYIAFSADEKSKQFSLEGKVTKNFVLKPVDNKIYRHFVKERGLKSNASFETKEISNRESIANSYANPSQTIEFFTSNRAELKRKNSDKISLSKLKNGDSAELDGSALRRKMFECFSKNDRLPLKEILNYCVDVEGFRREQDLKDLLNEYARYNYKGPYKQLWELKPEYRDYSNSK